MKALVQLAFGEDVPDCTKCEGQPSLRAEYGCDGPARRPVLEVSCSLCAGAGCEDCVRGMSSLYRCPLRLTERRGDIREAFWLCQQYEANAVMPAAGGMMDQSAGWIALLHSYQREHGVIEQARRKKEERARRVAEAKGRRRG